MLKGIQILRIGIAVTSITLGIAHAFDISHGISAFFMGLGCSLTIVGAGKRFVEMGKK